MSPRWIVAGLLLISTCVEGASRASLNRRWEAALVTLEVSSKQYDYLQPWSRGSQTVLKPGVALGDGQLLTTASGLANRTVVRAQAGGRGLWYDAEVTWIEPAANLALLTVSDAAFWKGAGRLRLSRTIPADDKLQFVRWRNGSLEVRQAEFNRFTVSNPTGGDAAHVVLEVNSEIAGLGWGEPLLAGDRVVGLAFAQRGNLCQVLPAPFIESILQAQARKTYRGLGYFDFTWQMTENPETLRYLDVPPNGHGVVVIDVPRERPAPHVLRPRDVILEVDGFVIDHQGDYEDPLYGHLMLEALSTRQRWVGDRIPMKIWREGGPLTVEYTLPPIADSARLVPEAPADQPPEYLIAGGFLLQPLTRNYLRSWGADWERTAPFRLAYFRHEEPTPERPGLVVLSSVLPDPINLGYQDLRTLVVRRINERPVSSLSDVTAALAEPRDGYHVFEFLQGESLQRLVLDASQMAPATQRVLQRYGIETASYLRDP